jgi:hypothetical protein
MALRRVNVHAVNCLGALEREVESVAGAAGEREAHIARRGLQHLHSKPFVTTTVFVTEMASLLFVSEADTHGKAGVQDLLEAVRQLYDNCTTTVRQLVPF